MGLWACGPARPFALQSRQMRPGSEPEPVTLCPPPPQKTLYPVDIRYFNNEDGMLHDRVAAFIETDHPARLLQKEEGLNQFRCYADIKAPGHWDADRYNYPRKWTDLQRNLYHEMSRAILDHRGMYNALALRGSFEVEEGAKPLTFIIPMGGPSLEMQGSSFLRWVDDPENQGRLEKYLQAVRAFVASRKPAPSFAVGADEPVLMEEVFPGEFDEFDEWDEGEDEEEEEPKQAAGKRKAAEGGADQGKAALGDAGKRKKK